MKYPIILSILAITLFTIACKKDKPDTIENCRLKSVNSSVTPIAFASVYGPNTPTDIDDIEYNGNDEIIAFTDSANWVKEFKLYYLTADNENESIFDNGFYFDGWSKKYLYHNDLLIEKSQFHVGLNLSCSLEKFRYDDQNRLEFYQFSRLNEYSTGIPIGSSRDTSQLILREKRFEYKSETELVVNNLHFGLPNYSYSHTETYSKNQGEPNWTKCNLKLNKYDEAGDIISTSERVFDFEYDNYPVVSSNELEVGLSLNSAFNNANNLIKVSGDGVAYDLSIVNDGFFCELLLGSCSTDNYLILIDYVFDENDKLIEHHYQRYTQGFSTSTYFEYECD